MSGATCSECGTSVDPDAIGVWSEITGWTIPRTGGGPNRRDLTPTGRYLCRDCGKLRDLGVVPGQESLL